jgi:hypothetical protein
VVGSQADPAVGGHGVPVILGTPDKSTGRPARCDGPTRMPIVMALGDGAGEVAKFRSLAAAAGRDIAIFRSRRDRPSTLCRATRDLDIRRVVLGVNRDGGSDAVSTRAFITHYIRNNEGLRR